jgi:hypothetical protein
MHQVEALEPEHPQAPARQVEERRAAHPSETQHNRIVCGQRSSLVAVARSPALYD